MSTGEGIGRKLDAYWRLVRLDKPIGTLLLLWPTLSALWIAAGWLRVCDFDMAAKIRHIADRMSQTYRYFAGHSPRQRIHP